MNCGLHYQMECFSVHNFGEAGEVGTATAQMSEGFTCVVQGTDDQHLFFMESLFFWELSDEMSALQHFLHGVQHLQALQRQVLSQVNARGVTYSSYDDIWIGIPH